MTEDEMVGWRHRLNGCEFEQALGNSEGQGGLACCSPWGHRESDTTQRVNKSSATMVLLSAGAGSLGLTHLVELKPSNSPPLTPGNIFYLFLNLTDLDASCKW